MSHLGRLGERALAVLGEQRVAELQHECGIVRGRWSEHATQELTRGRRLVAEEAVVAVAVRGRQSIAPKGQLEHEVVGRVHAEPVGDVVRQAVGEERVSCGGGGGGGQFVQALTKRLDVMR